MRVLIEHRISFVRDRSTVTQEEWEKASKVEWNGQMMAVQHVYLLEAENGVRKHEMSWEEMPKGYYTLPDSAFPFPETTEGDPAYMNSQEYHEYLERHGVA